MTRCHGHLAKLRYGSNGRKTTDKFDVRLGPGTYSCIGNARRSKACLKFISWGSEKHSIANHIGNPYNLSVSECGECKRLRSNLVHATVVHTELEAQLKQALERSKGEIVTNLMLSVPAALRERGVAEIALRSHESVAHGGWEGVSA